MMKLAKECKTRIQKFKGDIANQTSIFSDVKVELRFIGKIAEDDLKYVSHRRGNILLVKFYSVYTVHMISFFVC